MNYLIINGSPREKNTWSMAKQAQSNLKGNFEEIHLIAQNIPLCIGCMKCITEGEDKCPHYSKIHPIIEKIRQCDGIIITSPVYAMNVTGLLKNFLDHTAYLYHRPEFFTKKALVIVSTAGAGHKKVAGYIDETLRHWGVNRVYKIAMVWRGKESLDRDKINRTAEDFERDVESGKLHSPKFKDIVFFDLWKAMAVSQNPIDKDKEYWEKTGLVKNDFSAEVKLNPFKKLLSKLMFNIFKRIIK